MGVKIPEYVLEKTNWSEEELLIEIAVHLYDIEKLTMGQSRRLAKLDQISFQKELAKRNIFIKYDIEDLKEDLNSIDELNMLEN